MAVMVVVDDEMPSISTTGKTGLETLDYDKIRAMFRNFEDIFDIF